MNCFEVWLVFWAALSVLVLFAAPASGQGAHECHQSCPRLYEDDGDTLNGGGGAWRMDDTTGECVCRWHLQTGAVGRSGPGGSGVIMRDVQYVANPAFFERQRRFIEEKLRGA